MYNPQTQYIRVQISDRELKLSKQTSISPSVSICFGRRNNPTKLITEAVLSQNIDIHPFCVKKLLLSIS